MKEEAVSFGTDGCLTGVITDAVLHGGARADLVGDETVPIMSAPANRPAFVFLNEDATHHVGLNGLYVRLARALARQGFPSIRFDFSGRGDSGQHTDASPETQSEAMDTREAMDLLARTRGVRSFVPVGMCRGAIHAFAAAQSDARVSGAVLINAQRHLHGSDPELGEMLTARTRARHSWRVALKSSFRSRDWKKLLGGQLAPGRILSMLVAGPVRSVTRRSADSPDSLEMLQTLTDRGVHLYHLYCEGDESLDYFHTVLGKGAETLRSAERSRVEVIPGADQEFSLMWSQDELVKRMCRWAQELPLASAPVTVGA